MRAYLSNLVRTSSGPYTLSDAWTIRELEYLDPCASWPELALHPDTALPDWPALLIDQRRSGIGNMAALSGGTSGLTAGSRVQRNRRMARTGRI